jgi:predicted extracellular nuclease
VINGYVAHAEIAVSTHRNYHHTDSDQVRGDWKVSGKNSRGGLTVTDRDSNPESIIIGAPLDGSKNDNATKLGDELEDITGVVTYVFGFYAIFPQTGTKVKRSIDAFPPPSAISSNGRCNGLTFGQYNIENFAPNNSRVPLVAEHIVDYLNTPSIMFLQEVQDNSGETNDGVTNSNLTLASLSQAISEISGVDYLWVNVDPVNNQDGGAPGGNIQTPFLYNPLVVRLRNANPGNSTDRNEVLPGPSLRFNPGRIDDGETFSNSRKPVVAHWEMVDGSGTFFTVNNHWTSKGGSSSLQGDARPPVNGGVDRRMRQAEVTGSFIAEILAQDTNAAIIVAGDFNEFATTEPLRRFVEVSGLKDLDVVAKIPELERYSYTFGASQQQLDHVYASAWASRNVVRKDFEHVHVNTWVAEEDVASDHDPAVARLNVCSK